MGQFRCLGVWPDNSCKWLLIDTQVGSLTAGGTATLTLTKSGAGNFGGSNLATDNGSTITVATGTATFTIRKANFDLINKAVVGTTTISDSSASANPGLVLTAPVYPNTTCLTPPSDCTTEYRSSNDAASTAVIEENGPARAVIKASGALSDSSGNVYLRFTVRMHFYRNKSYVKVVSALQNADISVPTGSFASAYKAFKSYEARIGVQLGAGKNALFAKTGGTQSYAFSGTENAYEYQAYSTSMQTDQWNAADVVSFISRTATGGTPPYVYDQDGYQVVAGGTTLTSGTSSQYSKGWGDLKDSSNVGVLAGFYQMSAYWPKSVQFMNGGSEVRLGIWPDQNLMNQVPTKAIPYYIPYPHYLMDTFFLDFHGAAVSPDTDTEFQKMQSFLLARAPVAYYNTTDALWFKLLDPAAQDTYYASIGASATPAFSASRICCSTDFNPSVFHRYGWNGPGGDNSSDFRYDYLMQFIERGWTGRYLWAYHFNKFILERTAARADGFTWRTYATQSALNGLGQPTGVVSANNAKSWISPPDGLHSHFYGIIDWYFATGDGFYKDFIDQAIGDDLNPNTCANRIPTNNSSSNGYCMEAQRATGINMNFAARLLNYANSTNQTALATQATTVTDNMFAVVSSPVQASGTDVNTTYTWPYDQTKYQYGTNTARGMYIGGSAGSYFTTNSTFDYPGCANGGPNKYTNSRLAQTYQVGMVIEGLGEIMKVRGPNWTNYVAARELGLGMAQWATKEAAVNNSDWTVGGFRYSVPPDHTCSAANKLCECEAFYAAGYNYGNWPIFSFLAKYSGDTSAKWLFERALQKTAGRSGGAAASNAWPEQSSYGIADAMYWLYANPPATVLQTVPITVTDLGSGSYKIDWTPPAGTNEYRLKYKPGKTVVDWLNFDVTTSINDSDGGTFGLDPSTNQPFFSAAFTPTQPSPSASSITVSGLPTGLKQNNFMLKAVATSVSSTDTTPPTVSITSPTAGAILANTGTFTITATASDNVGVAGVQFKIDGNNYGPEVLSTPYAVTWNLSQLSVGAHTVTAVVRDAAGNLSISPSISVTISAAIDTTPPSVAITAPTASTKVTGVILVTATAGDNVGVAGVQFLLDGSALGTEQSNSPYSAQWNTASVADGNHVLTAIARDAAGNKTTSAAVTVSVSNTSSGVVSGPGWRKICDNVTGNCPVGPLWAGARGYMNVLPYDSSRHEFLYLGSVRSNADIYSTAIWGYAPTVGSLAGHMTLRIDNGMHSTTGDHNVCAYYTGTSPIPGAASANPESGHPNGNAAFDTLRNKMYSSGWLCNNYFGGTTSSYDSVSATMDPAFIGNEYNACTGPAAPAACNEGRSFQSWAYIPKGPSGNSVDKVLLGLSDGNSSRLVVEYNPATQKYTNITAQLKGTDGAACNSTNCPPAVITSYGAAYNSADGYVYIYGGCNGTLPGNGSPNPCTGKNLNDLWKYDGENRRFIKVAPTGGVLPPATNASSPFFAYDSQRNRLVLYADTNALWSYSPSTNAWTLTTTSGGPAITSFMQGHPYGQVSGYDPNTDTFVLMWIDSGGQANSPSIWELGFSTNAQPDTTAPTVTLTNPPNNATLTGGVTLTATASDNIGIAGVQFAIDNVNVGPLVTTPPYSYIWNSATAKNGQHTVTAIAQDLSGNFNRSSAKVTTSNVLIDATPPTVSITAPTAGQTVSGSVSINITASDNVGIASVVVKVDGVQIGNILAAAPYTTTWDSSNAVSGTHTITAIAQDTSGNTATASVSIQVASKIISTTPGFTVDSTTQFSVQTDDLTNIFACPTCYFSTAADLIPGQTIEIRFRAGTTNTADSIVLQQGTVNGTVTSSLGLNFIMQASDTVLGQQNVTVAVGSPTQYVGLPQGSTLTVGQKVAVRGLLLKTGQSNGPTLVAKQITLIQ